MRIPGAVYFGRHGDGLSIELGVILNIQLERNGKVAVDFGMYLTETRMSCLRQLFHKYSPESLVGR